MNVVMIGTGYVGLVTGLGFAKLGHRVACVDVDARKIGQLEMGQVTFYEEGLPELLKEMIESGRVLFTTDLGSVIGSADVIMIAVGTPPGQDGAPNLSYVEAVADEIGMHLDHEAVVVMKSTVPAGTNRRVLARIRAKMEEVERTDVSSLVHIVSLPEFLSEGRAVEDFFHPNRIVIGADDPIAHTLIDRMHEGLNAPRMLTTIENAELIKLASNAFLATKISFANEIANIAERVGADVREVVKGVGLDHRIGTHFMQAGLGYGGSCFPKDVNALHHLAGTRGYDFKLLSAVIEANNRQRDLFFQKVQNALGDLRGRRIGVWGLAFKGRTDDIRDSAAIDIVQRLFARGAEVVVYDPAAMQNAKQVLSDRVEFAPTASDAADGTEALLVLPDWQEFREVSLSTLKEKMLEPRVFDGRNLLADLHLPAHGFFYQGVGISPQSPS